MQQLRTIQADMGVVIAPDSGVPLTFGNDQAALEAATEAVALYDRSHWGRLQLTGADRQTFLHNQSTNEIKSLQPGAGCDTIFVTSTARTIDLATVYVLDDRVMGVVSPNRREFLLQWLDRYIFFSDKVKVEDVTEQTAMFSLIGTGSEALLQHLGVSPRSTEYASHQTVTLAGQLVQVAVGSGLASPGYTLLMAITSAVPVWQALVAAGAVTMGDRVWEQLRIQQGRPAPDYELTEEYNAVEACLWQAISLTKGCYIGQETIARLDTYKGVKQQIWGIQFAQTDRNKVEPGTPILIANEKVGVVTSVTTTETGRFGLGYVRTRASQVGTQVQVGEQIATLIEVPFLHRSRSADPKLANE